MALICFSADQAPEQHKRLRFSSARHPRISGVILWLNKICKCACVEHSLSGERCGGVGLGKAWMSCLKWTRMPSCSCRPPPSSRTTTGPYSLSARASLRTWLKVHTTLPCLIMSSHRCHSTVITVLAALSSRPLQYPNMLDVLHCKSSAVLHKQSSTSDL